MHSKSSHSEKLADGFAHILAVLSAIVGSILLITYTSDTQVPGLFASVWIYCGVMLLSFTVSGIYNLWPYEWMFEPLRRVDHAAIYLKIAGTYTPLVVMLGSYFGYLVLAFVWTIALCGVVGKLVVRTWPYGLNTAMTLTLGWSSLILLWPLTKTLPHLSLTLIFCGGILYSIGTIFYVNTTWRFHTAIWHMFVLAASASIFVAISIALVHVI